MEARSKQDEYAAIVGLDWADRKHDICVYTEGSDELESSRIEHKPEVINEWVSGLRKRFGGKPVAIGLEQNKGGLAYSLMQYDFIVLYLINPSTSSRYREAWKPSKAKDDITDAELLMDIVRLHRDKLRAWHPDDAATRQLGLLCEHRRKAVDLRVKLPNKLRSALKCYYPLACEVAGDKLNSPMALRFLKKWPSFEALKKARPKTLEQFYHRLNSRYPKAIQSRLESIRTAEPLTTDSVITEVYAQQVLMFVDQLEALQKHIVIYGKSIDGICAEHKDAAIFQSFPGSGKTFAPRLLTAFGSRRDRYESAQSVQNLSGIAPVIEASGKSHWVHRRRGCQRFTRQTFHEYAATSILHSMWARAYYVKARERGMGHHAAVRALAFKWIRIMFKCWKDGKPYDEITYLTALKKRDSSLWQVIAEHPEAIKYAS